MSVAPLLSDLLTTGAALAASGAVSEFAKGAGKAAFEALKTRLGDRHGVTALPPFDRAAETPAVAAALEAALAKPEIVGDGEGLRLAETLRAAIEALPAETQARYAVDVEYIRSGAALLFEAVESIKAKSVTADGDLTFRNVSAPPGKPQAAGAHRPSPRRR